MLTSLLLPQGGGINPWETGSYDLALEMAGIENFNIGGERGCITAQGCMYTLNVKGTDSNGLSPLVHFVAVTSFGNCTGVEHTLQLLIAKLLMLSDFAAVTYTSCIPAEANEVPVNAVKHMFHHGAVLESIQAAMCALQLSPGTANFLVCPVMHMFHLGDGVHPMLLIVGTASISEEWKFHASYVAMRVRGTATA